MRDRPHVILLWVLLGALALLAVFLAAPAYAAVVGEWRVNLLRGSTTQAQITGQTADEAWDSCVERIAAQSPSSSTWTCQTPRYVARVIADPVPVCDPLPDPVTEDRQCPEGTVGTWQQTQAYISEPYPLCRTAGPWVPAEPPTGACVEPPPPPTGDWVHCADQGERCEFSGTRVVRYGLRDTWAEREFTDGLMCDNVGFGSNPYRGVSKVCEIRGTTGEPPPSGPPPTQPPATGTATLNWTPPATMTDGTQATLAGFRIRYGTTPENLSRLQDTPNVTTATVDALAAGTWHFNVSAVDSQGRESLPSNTASKVIQ